MKGQYLLDGGSHAIIQLAGNSCLCLLLAAFEFKSEFDEKELVKNHADVGRRAERLQLVQALSGLGPVHVPQGCPRRDQSQVRANRRWNRIRQIGSQVVERGVNCPPKPARGKPSCGFVNGYDTANFQRLCRLLFRAILRIAGIAQDFKLRLDDLQFASVLILLHLAVERNHLTGDKFVLQIGLVKEETAQAGAALPHRKLEDGHLPGAKETGVPNLSDNGCHFSGTQFRDPARVEAVFIAEREIMEQVADGENALRGKDFRNARTDAFYVLHGRGEFKHARKALAFRMVTRAGTGIERISGARVERPRREPSP